MDKYDKIAMGEFGKKYDQLNEEEKYFVNDAVACEHEEDPEERYWRGVQCWNEHHSDYGEDY